MAGESWEQHEAHQGVECDDFDKLQVAGGLTE